ncbi:MAG: amino acid ABC transporter permease [Verrucomicrobiota bacterium]|jgi:polar amino acid transport system permease protein
MQRLLFLSPDPRQPLPPLPIRSLNFLLALGLISLVFHFAFAQLNYHWNWPAVYTYRLKFLQGWFNTILISLFALVLSLLIGLLAALSRRSRFLPLRYAASIYIEVIRGTPLLVQILVFFYVVAAAFGVRDRYVVGVLTLAVFSGAYIAEIIRAGIESIGQSQLESARSIGLTPAQIYRFIIFPQAVRLILPPLAGQFVSLIKDSSLLSVIAINEFTLNAQEVNAYTFSTLEGYVPLAIGYLVLTLPISFWTRRLEQQHRYET